METASTTPTATEPRVIKLADMVNDVRYDDVVETLRYVTEAAAPGGKYEKEGFVPTKIVCVMVDERDGRYNVKVRPSATKTSETVALLELAKQLEIRDMFTPE